MTSRRILVVEGEARIREVITTCLRRLGGWEVVTATSGQEALNQAQVEHPDLMILDGMLPEMEGLAFLQSLRSDPRTQDIPVILLTASSYPPDFQKFPQSGVVLTLTKPFKATELIQQINQVMGWQKSG